MKRAYTDILEYVKDLSKIGRSINDINFYESSFNDKSKVSLLKGWLRSPLKFSSKSSISKVDINKPYEIIVDDDNGNIIEFTIILDEKNIASYMGNEAERVFYHFLGAERNRMKSENKLGEDKSGRAEVTDLSALRSGKTK